jgi:Zn-dependent peptidase ImmA (M78 family)
VPADLPHLGEQKAGRAREAMGLGGTAPVPDIVELIERKAGVPVFLTPLPDGIAGLASRLDGRWYIVGDSRSSIAGRLRFTLAHELGHILMGHEPAVDDDATLREGPDSRGSHEQEVEANYFAAEFLVPRDLVMGRLTGSRVPDLEFVQEIAVLTGTTAWVPLYRIKTLDLLDWTAFLTLQAEIQNAPLVASAADIAARYAQTGETRFPPPRLGREVGG